MIRVLMTLLVIVWAQGVTAQSVLNPELQDIADSTCAPFGVVAAEIAPDGILRVTCNEDATAFVPLLGGLAPALGLGAAAAAAAALAGGNATPDTQ